MHRFISDNRSLSCQTNESNGGFTAVEFLIAMAVFSFVLTLSTIGFIQVSRMYQNGLATQKAQDTTRHVQADISRTLRESDHIRVANSGGSTIVCSSKYRFFTQRNSEGNSVLYKQAISGDANPNGPCVPLNGLNSNNNAFQLTDNELVVLKFNVTPFNELDDGSGYHSVQIVLRVGTAATRDLIGRNDKCDPSEAGSHFCAVSEQVTIVTAREAP